MKKFLFLIILGGLFSVSFVKAEDVIYVSDGKVYYDCPDGDISAPAEYNIDMDSVEIINHRFFRDKDYLYHASRDNHSHFCYFNKMDNIDVDTFEYFNDRFQRDKDRIYLSYSYWGWGYPDEITERYVEGAMIDVDSFQALSNYYAKDKDHAYYVLNSELHEMEGVDVESFEVFRDDVRYAFDKNEVYEGMNKVGDMGDNIYDNDLYNSLKGKIILRVEDDGQAYYVHPGKRELYSLSRPAIAFAVLRKQGIGISNDNLKKIPVADNYCPTYDANCDSSTHYDYNFAKKQAGNIFLQVENNGEAWYVNPTDNKRYFLGRPIDAFNIMKKLGLGVADNDYYKLISGELQTFRNMNHGYEVKLPKNWKSYSLTGSQEIIADSIEDFSQDKTLLIGYPTEPIFSITYRASTTIEQYRDIYLKNAEMKDNTYIKDNYVFYLLQKKNELIIFQSDDKDFYLNNQIFASIIELYPI